MSASAKMISLKSSDGDSFKLAEEVARESHTIKLLIEDNCADNCIPLPNVNSKILSLIVEYLNRHVEARKTNEDLKSFDAEFLKVDQDTLFDIIQASNYLDIKLLLDLTCKNVADMIRKSKTVEEIRRKFNIQSDFNPKEEAEFRRENAWAFE